MQNFLPYKSYERSAACLDMRRCGNQRKETLECLIILNGLVQPEWMSDGWFKRIVRHRYHPAVLMWDGYVEDLVEYGCAICDNWLERGYHDHFGFRDKIVEQSWGDSPVTPPWLTSRLIRSHRSNLLRKKPEWYGRFNWNVPDNLPYVWPR